MPIKPVSVDLYTYNVFFGDCFLLIFNYDDGTQRSILIDFGSTGKGKPAPGSPANTDESSTGERLLEVAKHISQTCDQKLNVVVATHRHKDHIYGFGLKEAGKIILDCNPDSVIQPWTENPADNRDFSKKKNTAVDPNAFAKSPRKSFTSMLNDMHSVAAAIEAEATHLADKTKYTNTIDPILRDDILFAADDNKKIPNASAIKNLQSMEDPHYVHFGYNKVKWDKLLPGIKVRILGPPLLEDYPDMAGATTSSDEFWSLLAVNKFFWGILAATNRPEVEGDGFNAPLFDPHKALKRDRPQNVRWFIRRLRDLRATQLLELVGFVDNALNNTSVILHFEVGDQKMLFPGDAQIENWQFLLNAMAKDPALKKLLADTTLYKVGHHGSRNATPRSLWGGFKNVADKKVPKDKLLKTVVSTMSGKHGKSENTVVPLRKLIETMKAQSELTDTEEFVDSYVKKITLKINY